MNRLLALLVFLALAAAAPAEPLRVFIRGGKKSHGPNQHEHERFLNDWKVLLTERGIKTDGAMDFPTADQLAQTDVLVMYAQDGGNISPEQRPALETFIKRGGGLVVIHTASVANMPDTSPYWKSIIGGSWVQGQTKWKEGPMDLYYTENQRLGGGHPITRGASNFHLDDEIYYDMDLSPDIEVLATAYTPNVKDGKKPAEGGKPHIYDIQPQMWTYERTAEGGAAPYRAFVSIPGHLYDTFEKPNYRAILLRGIAWAGKRANVDEFTTPEEISLLRYPEGGPEKPDQTLANLEVHPDFTMKLVAAEPLITKPICIDWDPAGRLWVAETPEYPNGRRGMRPDYRGKEWKDHGGIDPDTGEQARKAQDKISRLLDTDGDGIMDKKEVFAEGLDLVTGFVFYKDGVIVTQAPDILFLRDTDGDGKADKIEKLYTGLGTRDTHAVINNPRWGWDGWIYATHGYSSSSEVKNASGEAQGTIGSGVVRFRPDGSKIEQYSSKGGNTWGLTVTGDNRILWTQPTSGQLLMQTVLPEYALARGKIGNTTSFKVVEPSGKSFPAMTWSQLAYAQIDYVGSFTAAAGCAIYDGGSWPAEYNGDYFCTEPTINIIHHTRLTPDGSSYTTHKLPGREETEFVRSKDMWWRPIEVRVGPDGALYVCDFYNQAVIHNDTRGPDHNNVNAAVRPDRDHYFGRIWRLDHKQAQKLTVPDLVKANEDDLVKALDHPNRVVRMTASRLLADLGQEPADKGTGQTPDVSLAGLLGAKMAAGRASELEVASLWTMQRLGMVKPTLIENDLASKDPIIRRNAANLAEGVPVLPRSLGRLFSDSDGAVRVAALRALATQSLDQPEALKDSAAAIVAAWPKFDDDFQRSAAVGAASKNPVAVISAALESSDPSSFEPLVTALTQGIDPDTAGKLVAMLADKPASADALKRSILVGVEKTVKDAPSVTPELSAALGKLLDSNVSQQALPLVAKWDKTSALKPQIAKLTAALRDALATGNDDARLAAARSMLGLRSTNAEALPSVVAQLGGEGSPGFKRQLIAALAETDDASVGIALTSSYAKLPTEVQTAAFDALLKRADWTNAFLDAVKAKQVDTALLGPANAFRLRSHPDKTVAKRAVTMLDELNPMAKVKKEAIAKLMPAVEQKGDPEKGKQLFTQTCALCHNFHGVGAEIGPGLTGMGAHGASELLGAIVDPNAEVDPAFTQWNIETKDGGAFAGIIASENPTTITLKSLAGIQQVKVADIKTRTNTGRSLMPEGFDGLGGETLRDIIAYMQNADGGRFRTIDLREAFTANTGAGLYVSQENRNDSLTFTKTGNVTVEGIPFHIVGPEKAPLNVVVLRGGPEKSFSGTLPAKVEARVGGFTANRLHFLGGVAGWGSKGNREPRDIVRLNVHYSDGQRETIVLQDGVEFADYIGRFDVPGSKATEGLVKSHQLRWFSKQLSRTGAIDKITLDSPEVHPAAATIVAITAELADAKAAPLPPIVMPKPAAAGSSDAAGFVPQFTDAVPQPPATRPASGPRVLLVGGGSSHNFVKFFGESDKATLAPGVGWVDFTQNANGVASILDRVDVLVWSANQPISSETRVALINYVNSGKGLIAYHPGTWYAWPNFPQWNKEVVGGGARGHDRLGEFEVAVVNATHPIMAGVPAKFAITDELYNFIPGEQASPIEVLATATSPTSGKTFPQVFVVKHLKSRIVGLTLGHDERAHDLPAFQSILRQAVAWAAGR